MSRVRPGEPGEPMAQRWDTHMLRTRTHCAHDTQPLESGEMRSSRIAGARSGGCDGCIG